MTEKKTVQVVGEEGINLDAPLSHLLLSVTHEKYRMISLATRWAQEIKVRDQSILPPQELLAQALREMIGKKVSMEDIEKLPPPPKTEKKDPEFTLPTLSLKEEPAPAEKPAEE